MALTVVGVLFVVAILAVVVGVVWLGNKAKDAIGTVTPCPYITDAEATQAVGTDADAELFTGLGRVLNITDPRVLPDKESCILQQHTDPSTDPSTGSTMPGLGRAVRYTGADATMLYEQELAKAKGIVEERGNGVTVESSSYFNHDVAGLGDRAFCTKSSGLLAGVLVQEGDTLVYVALTQAGAVPGVDLDDPGNARISTDEPACAASQDLARTILAKG